MGRVSIPRGNIVMLDVETREVILKIDNGTAGGFLTDIWLTSEIDKYREIC